MEIALIERFDLDVLPTDFHRFRLLADAVDLQRDETLRREIVLQIRGGDAIDEGLDRIAFANDAELIPLVLLERFAGGGVFLEVVEPTASAFIVDAGGVGPITGVDLALVTEDPATLAALDGFVAGLFRFAFGNELAANLNAGIQAGIDLEIENEFKVLVFLLGAEERVRRVRHGTADDCSVFNLVVGLAAALDPPIEVFAVEKRLPTIIVGIDRGGKNRGQGQ